jgi:hypothetical protein
MKFQQMLSFFVPSFWLSHLKLLLPSISKSPLKVKTYFISKQTCKENLPSGIFGNVRIRRKLLLTSVIHGSFFGIFYDRVSSFAFVFIYSMSPVICFVECHMSTVPTCIHRSFVSLRRVIATVTFR